MVHLDTLAAELKGVVMESAAFFGALKPKNAAVSAKSFECCRLAVISKGQCVAVASRLLDANCFGTPMADKCPADQLM